MDPPMGTSIADQVAQYVSQGIGYLQAPPEPRLTVLALAFFQKALDLDPANARTHLHMGRAQHRLGDQSAALLSCEKALQLDPQLFAARVCRCIWQIPLLQEHSEDVVASRERFRARLLELVTTIERMDAPAQAAIAGFIAATVTFCLAYQGYDVLELQRIYGRMVSRVLAVKYPQWSTAPALLPPAPGVPLRIGFVSPCFSYDHPDWRMIMHGWIAKLDRMRFAVFGYSLFPQSDSSRELVGASCDKFVEGNYSLEQWAEIISADQPQVLIYPEIGTSRSQLELAALRLAPVQCATWGNPMTTGLPTIDYFLSSDLAEPINAQEHYSEQLVKLPYLSVHLWPRPLTITAHSRSDFQLREDAVVYMCDQALYKYLPQYDDVFPQIARAVKNCQFVFSRRSEAYLVVRQFELRLERAFASYGLRWNDYVLMRPTMDRPSYHGLCSIVDVYLDSIGYSGCTSTTDAALTHDLPVVSMSGEFMRGRQTFAILRRMGVIETIVADPAEYVAIAARLGTDAPFRRQVAQRMAENKYKVFGDMTCITALEDFLERAVRDATNESKVILC